MDQHSYSVEVPVWVLQGNSGATSKGAALLRPVHSPRDKNIFFLGYYAPYVRYLIDFLYIIIL